MKENIIKQHKQLKKLFDSNIFGKIFQHKSKILQKIHNNIERKITAKQAMWYIPKYFGLKSIILYINS